MSDEREGWNTIEMREEWERREQMSDESEGWNTIEMKEECERMKHKRGRRGILMEQTKEKWNKSR